MLKKSKKDIVIICGGPNIDCNDDGYREFFEINQNADFYVPYQGEPGFINFLNLIFNRWKIINDSEFEILDGLIEFDKNLKRINIGKILPRLKNPNEVPSPYLNGTLDSFFETMLIPIIETNRGCPYCCSFCAQGFTSFHKIDFFDIERVKDEIEYIAKKIKNTSLLLFADSNFGINNRDLEIAEFIVKMREKYGYPKHCSMNWAKNNPEIYKIARILNENAPFILSLQSLDETVLTNIKRRNINIETFKNIINKCNDDNINQAQR